MPNLDATLVINNTQYQVPKGIKYQIEQLVAPFSRTAQPAVAESQMQADLKAAQDNVLGLREEVARLREDNTVIEKRVGELQGRLSMVRLEKAGLEQRIAELEAKPGDEGAKKAGKKGSK